MKEKVKVFIIWLILLVASILIQGGIQKEKKMDWSSYANGTDRYVIGDITDTTNIIQNISTKGKEISSIGVKCATYNNRENVGNIELVVYDLSGTVVGSAEYNVNTIEDNEYVWVKLVKSEEIEEVYSLKIQASDTMQGKAISAWSSRNDAIREQGGELIINGEVMDNQLEIIMGYQVIAWERILLAMILSSLLLYFVRKC